MSLNYATQNSLLLDNLIQWYDKTNNLENMINIINGSSKISLRIVDWFTTNYAKKYYTLYNIVSQNNQTRRFKVYIDYKLKLKAYSKKRFDPFCRWERITIPYENGSYIQTTLGQLNFFKWAIENEVINYIQNHYKEIEDDMNSRNSNSRKREIQGDNKTRKKREELSILASKSVKKEDVEIVVRFT